MRIHDGVEQLLLVAEIRVDEGLVHLCRGAYAVDSRTGDTAGRELVRRGFEQAGLGGLGVPGRAGGWCWGMTPA